MTTREKQLVRKTAAITAAIALIAALIAGAGIQRITETQTLNRVAGSCTDPKASGFIIKGQIFFCRPFTRQPVTNNQQLRAQ